MREAETEGASSQQPAAWLVWARLGVGLTAGLGLLVLSRLAKSEALTGPLLSAAAMTAALLPFVLLAGLGAMRPVVLAAWSAAAGVALFALGWRKLADFEPILFLAPLALFIAHHLVQTAAAARSWRAPYPAYFDLAWRHGVQLALALGFTLAMWILLALAAALFDLLGVKAVSRLIQQDVFYFPVIALAIAAGVHLTMERAGLVLGARNLALTLFSWLLPLLTLIALAFLAALPFRGVEAVWRGELGSGLLAWAAVLLIFLLNAAYQAGERPRAGVLAHSARIAALLLAPLVVLAVIGVTQRVVQYGLTPARVMACAGFVILAAYATAYALAALSRRGWLGPLGGGNVACAGVAVLVLMALLSPLADPTRLAIASQLARLEQGKVEADAFDYRFLARSGEHGKAALQQLAESSGDARATAIAQRARAALNDAPNLPLTPQELRERLELVGLEASEIPDGIFSARLYSKLPLAKACTGASTCALRRADIDGADGLEWLLLHNGDVTLLQPSDPADLSRPWQAVASACCVRIEAFRSGAIAPAPTTRWPDIQLGDDRLEWRNQEER
jgi:hypothetical protein